MKLPTKLKKAKDSTWRPERIVQPWVLRAAKRIAKGLTASGDDATSYDNYYEFARLISEEYESFCPVCKGQGEVPCYDCGGSGLVRT